MQKPGSFIPARMEAWEPSGANVKIKGATATGTSGVPHGHTALGAPLPTDRPTYAEVRCSGGGVFVGVARPDLELSADGFTQAGFWGVESDNGSLCHNNGSAKWDGQQGFGAGDVLGLLLQPEAGTLTVYKNNARLGQAVVPGMKLTNGKTVAGLGGGGLCWAVSISTTDSVELLSSADSLVYGTSTRSARGVAASHRDGLLLPAIRARGKLPPRLGIA